MDYILCTRIFRQKQLFEVNSIQFNLLYCHCTWYKEILSGESQLQTKQKNNNNLNQPTINNK